MEFTVEKIKVIGQKLSLPFSEVLSLVVFEEILSRISLSGLKDIMWLKTDGKKIKKNMVYYVEHIRKANLESGMKQVLKNKFRQTYQMEWEILYKDMQMEVVLNIQIEKVQVPFKIIIRPMPGINKYPCESMYVSLLEPNRKITYRKYPTELYLSECFYEIIDKLELIGDMFYYERAHHIIEQYTVDGRRLRFDFLEMLQNNPIPSFEERWSTVIGYKKYSYMKKKWISYHKESRDKIAEWEAVIELFDAFFTPIWSSIEKDEIFMGDWMPNLRRYLD
jgi:hypothetical protein